MFDLHPPRRAARIGHPATAPQNTQHAAQASLMPGVLLRVIIAAGPAGFCTAPAGVISALRQGQLAIGQAAAWRRSSSNCLRTCTSQPARPWYRFTPKSLRLCSSPCLGGPAHRCQTVLSRQPANTHAGRFMPLAPLAQRFTFGLAGGFWRVASNACERKRSSVSPTLRRLCGSAFSPFLGRQVPVRVSSRYCFAQAHQLHGGLNAGPTPDFCRARPAPHQRGPHPVTGELISQARGY